MVWGADVGFEEEGAGVLVGPVVGEGVFLFGVVLDVVDYPFERAVFFDEVVSC